MDLTQEPTLIYNSDSRPLPPIPPHPLPTSPPAYMREAKLCSVILI